MASTLGVYSLIRERSLLYMYARCLCFNVIVLFEGAPVHKGDSGGIENCSQEVMTTVGRGIKEGIY